jgi:hypothetical protein
VQGIGSFAHTSVFCLIADDGGFLTGSTFPINGGQHMF